MKKIYLLLCICSLFGSKTYAQKLIFSYDNAGNQIERRWICINCRTATEIAAAQKIAGKAMNNKNLKLGELSTLSSKLINTGPNPLSETLNVKWETPETIYLQKIVIYNTGGQQVFSKKYSPSERETQISFQELPSGTYIFIGYYTDSTKETLKIIKI